MRKKCCIIFTALLVIAVIVYTAYEHIGKDVFKMKGSNQSVIHSPYYKGRKEQIKNYNSKQNEAKNINSTKVDDDKQFSISFLKKVDLRQYQFVLGWYGDDGIAMARDITSKDIHIKNLNDNSEKVVNLDDCIIDYVDKKFLVSTNTGFEIYDSSKNTKKYIEATCEQMPRFIDSEGKYIRMDDNRQYYLVESATGRKIQIDAKISDYEAPEKVTGYPSVTLSDDGRRIYFTKGREIREGSIDKFSGSSKFADLPSNWIIAVYLRNIPGSDVMIADINCSDEKNGMTYYTINKSTKTFSKLSGISFFDSADSSMIQGSQNSDTGRVVYSEKNKKNGLYSLYIGNVKDGKVTSSKELILDGLPNNTLKENWTWSATWNKTADKIFISIIAAQGEGFDSGYYVDVK